MNDNNDKANAIIEAIMPEFPTIRDLMDQAKLLPIDMMRLLYQVLNIQKMSGYGSVKLTVKNGDVISISGENTFISEKELLRNLRVKENHP